MSKFISPVSEANVLTANDVDPKFELGQQVVTDDGRKFRYVKNGGAALTVGDLLQSPAEVTNHQNLAPTAATVIGDTSITVTLGNTLATANQYAGGYVYITAGLGAGYSYRIKSHPAAVGAATLKLTLEDSILVATNTSTTKVDLVLNPYKGVIQNPTSASGSVVGVAIYPLTISYYGFIQTGGVAPVLSQGGATVGTLQVASNGTPGAVEAAANASTEAQAIVGIAQSGIATTEIGPVKLLID